MPKLLELFTALFTFDSGSIGVGVDSLMLNCFPLFLSLIELTLSSLMFGI